MTQPHLQLLSDPRMAVKGLGHGLEQVMDWMKVNKPKLIPDKTKVGPASTMGGDCDLTLDWGSTAPERSGMQLGRTPKPLLSY